MGPQSLAFQEGLLNSASVNCLLMLSFDSAKYFLFFFCQGNKCNHQGAVLKCTAHFT